MGSFDGGLEDADWVPVELDSTAPSLHQVLLTVEPETRYQDALLRVTESMTSGARSVSIAVSAQAERSVRADTESARTASAVKADSRLVQTEKSGRASRSGPDRGCQPVWLP